MATLSFNHIYKVYPNGTKAVSDFCMDIKDGEFIVFVGPSGCGKSTTLRMIAGLEEISNGELYIDEKMVNYLEPKNRDIAMVFQNYALYPHLNVYENIAFGLKLRHLPKEEIEVKVHKAATLLGLTDYLKTKPGAMSGGQRQRVALGRALVREPKVFLLDEPLSNLDAKLRSSMRDEITKLHRKLKATFVYVTHDQVEAMTMGDRIVVMKLGFVQQIDTPKDLYRYPCNKFVAGFIGTPQMNFTDVTLAKENGMIRMSFTGTDTSFLLPFEYFYKVDPKYFDGKTVVSFALRSEYISADPKGFPYHCKVKISNVEELGTECQVFANFDLDKDVSLLETNEGETIRSNIAFKVNADYEGKAEDVIDISLDLKMMHLFDDDSENVINPRVPDHFDISVNVKDYQMEIMGNTIHLHNAFNIENGDYRINIPSSALSIKDKGMSLTVKEIEKVKDRYLLTFVEGEDVIFVETDKEYKVGDKVFVYLDLKQIDFKKNDEIIFNRIPYLNQINGGCYFHKEKQEKDGMMEKVKVLDYIIDDISVSCFNPVARRSFIENNDKSVYDLDLGFRFTIDQIVIDENGPFNMMVEAILDYGDEKIAKCSFKEETIYIKLLDIIPNIGEEIKAFIDFDNAQVINLEKDIRLV